MKKKGTVKLNTAYIKYVLCNTLLTKVLFHLEYIETFWFLGVRGSDAVYSMKAVHISHQHTV